MHIITSLKCVGTIYIVFTEIPAFKLQSDTTQNKVQWLSADTCPQAANHCTLFEKADFLKETQNYISQTEHLNK